MKNTDLKLGELLITPTAKKNIHIPDALSALVRHKNGDYGEISEEDKEANREALTTGERLLSAYTDQERHEVLDHHRGGPVLYHHPFAGGLLNTTGRSKKLRLFLCNFPN